MRMGPPGWQLHGITWVPILGPPAGARRLDASGHEKVPTGGHESPQWWSAEVPLVARTSRQSVLLLLAVARRERPSRIDCVLAHDAGRPAGDDKRTTTRRSRSGHEAARRSARISLSSAYASSRACSSLRSLRWRTVARTRWKLSSSSWRRNASSMTSSRSRPVAVARCSMSAQPLVQLDLSAHARHRTPPTCHRQDHGTRDRPAST